METNIELGEGQSFVIAGLIDNRVTETMSQHSGPRQPADPRKSVQEQGSESQQHGVDRDGDAGDHHAAAIGRSARRLAMPRDFMVTPASPSDPYSTPKTTKKSKITEDMPSEEIGEHPMTARGPVLTALSIVPNRELASQFSLVDGAHARLSDPGRAQAVSVAADA